MGRLFGGGSSFDEEVKRERVTAKTSIMASVGQVCCWMILSHVHVEHLQIKGD